MFDINEVLKQAAVDALDHLGVDVFVNGLLYRATLIDEEFEDNSGYRRDVILSFKKEDMTFIREKDSILLNCNEYIINRIQEDNNIDPFRLVELKRA